MIINELPIVMIKCLLITIIIEIIFALLLKIRDKKDILNILLVNIVTNPLVVSVPVLFNVVYGLFERNICLLILEILAVLLEGIVYKKYLNFKKINPFILSILLNLSSYLVGEIINNFVDLLKYLF